MFQKASRLKIRFDTPKGSITTEDLWDLPLTSNTGRPNLDSIACTLYRQLRELADVVSFVQPTESGQTTELQLKFDIVKHIIDVRVAERNAEAMARASREKKQQLLSIIEQKENAALTEMSLEDLKKMVESL